MQAFREYRSPCALSVPALGQGGRGRVEIVNLSPGGARIVADRPLAEGAVLRLELVSGIEPLTAEVRWARDGYAGLRFARPLPAAVVARLRGHAAGGAPPGWRGPAASARELR